MLTNGVQETLQFDVLCTTSGPKVYKGTGVPHTLER